MNTNVSNYALRVQSSLFAELKKVAEQEGTTINQLINVFFSRNQVSFLQN